MSPDDPVADVTYLVTDLGAPDSIEVVGALLPSAGIELVRHLVHCAAVGQHSGFRDEPGGWVNLTGTIALAQAVVPRMPPGGRSSSSSPAP